MNPFQTPGAFSWSELITNDVEAAKAFYGQVFGWQFKEGNIADAPYTVIEVAGKEIGGISPVSPKMPAMSPTWGTYVTVENVEVTLQTVEALGGKILIPPMPIPPTTCFALIQDPQGANVAVISYGQSI
jgi:predicted enzyme related to lactoylglutathione lyase